MKRRHYNKRVLTRWEILVGYSIIVGILTGIVLGMLNQPVVYKAEAQVNTTPEPKEIEVMIEVRVNWTRERIEKEIRDTFPETPNTAVAVMMAESNFNPNAYNPEWHRGCQGSFGLFQIACVHINPGEDMRDVKQNIQKARQIYLREGWKPWGGYTSGGYKKYL